MRGDRTVKQIAESLGLTPTNLYQWRSLYGPRPAPGGGEQPKRTLAQAEEENRELRAEVARMREREIVLKKSLGILSETPRERYAQVQAMKGKHTVAMLCDLLGVSRSDYYKWQSRAVSARQREDAILAARIAKSHRESRGNYGAPRIVEDLRAEGIRTGRRRCTRLMKDLGIRGRKKHRRNPRTTDSRHDQPVAPNLLASVEKSTAADQVWVTDITYLRTGEGWQYLAVVLDAWSRRAIGWACGPTLAASLVIAALRHALQRRRPAPGTIHHSDRGSQYVDADLIALLEAAGLVRSMSRAGNCYDNALIESFWSSLKTETQMDIVFPATRHDADLAVFDYIETFYNSRRRHSSLGYLSPVAFENQHIKAA